MVWRFPSPCWKSSPQDRNRLLRPVSCPPRLRRPLLPCLKPKFARCCSLPASAVTAKRTRSGGLRLDAPIPPENARAVVQRVKGEGGKPRMPLGSELPKDKIAALEAWVQAGAHWGSGPTFPASDLMEKGKTHWAFQPLTRRAVPKVEGCRLGAQPDRRLCPEAPGSEGTEALPDRHAPRTDPPPHLRSDRPAADPGRGRRLRGRQIARRL